MTLLRKAAYSLIFLGLAGSLWAADPFTGTFKLNLAKSKYPPAVPQPKAATVTAEDQGDNTSVMAKGTDPNGKPIAVKYTFPTKGGPHTYTEGGPRIPGSSVVVKRIDDHSFEDVTTKEGKQLETARFVLSADGKTVRGNIKGHDPQGKPVEIIQVWERQ